MSELVPLEEARVGEPDFTRVPIDSGGESSSASRSCEKRRRPSSSAIRNSASCDLVGDDTAVVTEVVDFGVCSRSMEQAVADLVGPDLRVLFCGINPGSLSGDLNLHFARSGNRFWKLLYAGGFTESVLSPAAQHTLLGLGIGITNLVGRVTSAASELSVAELREGAVQLEAKVDKLRPGCVAVLGLQAYRTAFLRTRAAIGLQPELLAGSRLWLLPNPSGLQARYQLREMTEMYKTLFESAFRAL
jgi:double-stranded uracil-DNA glycosylase